MTRQLLATLALAALVACSPDADEPDAAVPADAAVADAGNVSEDAGVEAGPFACGASTCQPGEYCETFHPGACGGTPIDANGDCPSGCSLCPSGTDCACPSLSCETVPDGCGSCACLEAAVGAPCTCTGFGAEGVFVTCSGA